MSREERVARNEALFREVNERIRHVSPDGAETQFVCECGDPSCTKPLSLTSREYEEVRSEPTRFAVDPWHVDREVEVVVSRNDRFAVVRKNEPRAARVAVQEDPRT